MGSGREGDDIGQLFLLVLGPPVSFIKENGGLAANWDALEDKARAFGIGRTTFFAAKKRLRKVG
jgi:hypothetical protein